MPTVRCAACGTLYIDDQLVVDVPCPACGRVPTVAYKVENRDWLARVGHEELDERVGRDHGMMVRLRRHLRGLLPLVSRGGK